MALQEINLRHSSNTKRPHADSILSPHWGLRRVVLFSVELTPKYVLRDSLSSLRTLVMLTGQLYLYTSTMQKSLPSSCSLNKVCAPAAHVLDAWPPRWLCGSGGTFSKYGPVGLDLIMGSQHELCSHGWINAVSQKWVRTPATSLVLLSTCHSKYNHCTISAAPAHCPFLLCFSSMLWHTMKAATPGS